MGARLTLDTERSAKGDLGKEICQIINIDLGIMLPDLQPFTRAQRETMFTMVKRALAYDGPTTIETAKELHEMVDVIKSYDFETVKRAPENERNFLATALRITTRIQALMALEDEATAKMLALRVLAQIGCPGVKEAFDLYAFKNNLEELTAVVAKPETDKACVSQWHDAVETLNHLAEKSLDVMASAVAVGVECDKAMPLGVYIETMGLSQAVAQHLLNIFSSSAHNVDTKSAALITAQILHSSFRSQNNGLLCTPLSRPERVKGYEEIQAFAEDLAPPPLTRGVMLAFLCQALKKPAQE